MSASSGSIKGEIDQYQDKSNGSSGSNESSSESSSQEEYYLFGVPRFPLKDFQEEMQCRAASRIEASSSKKGKLSSPPQDEEEDVNVIYSCDPEVVSILDVNRLITFVGRYQNPFKFKPCLPKSRECCCSPLFGFGVYATYLLAGLRFLLNSFSKGLFHRLGIGPNQLNPNEWRTIVAMQVLWCEVFEENCSITVDEFLFCYKPSKIKQSTGFYQFSSKGPKFSLIRGRSSSNRSWKKEFFFISGNWARDPYDVNITPFPPFTSALGRLLLEGTSFIIYFVHFIYFFSRLTVSFICVAITRPSLDKFYLERMDRAYAYPERSFHSLVTFRCLAIQGLGPKLTEENLAHKETTRRSKCRPSSSTLFFSFIFLHHRASHHERE